MLSVGENVDQPELSYMWEYKFVQFIHVGNYSGSIYKVELGIPNNIGVPVMGLYATEMNTCMFTKRHVPKCS